jgi:hypothetical protein
MGAESEVRMGRNPFAEFDDRRTDPPGSVPGTGLHRQVGSEQLPGGPAGRGWSLGFVGADHQFATLAVAAAAVGAVVWLVVLLLG